MGSTHLSEIFMGLPPPPPPSPGATTSYIYNKSLKQQLAANLSTGSTMMLPQKHSKSGIAVCTVGADKIRYPKRCNFSWLKLKRR